MKVFILSDVVASLGHIKLVRNELLSSVRCFTKNATFDKLLSKSNDGISQFLGPDGK